MQDTGAKKNLTILSGDVETKEHKSAESNLLNLLLEAPANICVLRGPHHIYELANEMYLKTIGKRDIVGKSVREVHPELEGQGYYELLDNVYLTGVPYIGNELLVMLDKGNGKLEETYSNFVYQPLHNNNGEIDGIFVHGIDVTEQVLARKKIEESETHLQLITDALPVLIAYIDKNRIYRFNNKAYETWFGRSSKEIYGKHLKDVLGEAAYENLKPKIDQVLSGKPVLFEAQVPYKDGGIRWVVADYIPHFGKDKEVVGYYGVVNEVTALKKAEELNLKLASIVQSSTDAIISKTLDGFVTSWNPGAEKIFGYTAAEMIGQPINRIIPDDRLDEEPGIIKKISQGSIIDTFNTQRLTKEGKLLDISLTISPIKDNDGKIIGASKIARDITDFIEAQKKIEESEKRFRSLADESPMFVFLIEPDPLATVSYWNKTWLNYTGQTAEQAAGRAWDGIVHPEDVTVIMDFYLPAFTAKQPYFIPAVRTRRHDGEYRWHTYKGNPRYLPNGEFNGYIGVGFDINDQKLAEDALKQSEELFNSFSNNIQNLAWIAEGDGNIFWYNQRWLDYTGLTLDEMKGWGWQKVHHPDHVERILEISKKLWISNEPFELTFPLRRHDGEYRWFLTRGVPISDEKGIITRWIGTNTDIDDKMKIENQIKESEERFRNLAQTLPQLVWVTDAQGIAEFASIRWKEYSGMEPGGEKEWKAIVHPDDYDGINAAWSHSLTTGNIYKYDVRLKSKEAEYRWFTVKGEPVLDKENKIIKWVGAFTDIHEQKIKEERKDEFISIASHELKTPLTTAKAYLQMLELTVDANNEDAVQFAKKANESVSRINELIGELLDVSKIRLGKLEYNITAFDFNAMVDSTVENIQLTSPTHTIVKTGKVLEEITGDKDRLQQVLINLLNNAIKYSPGSEKVYVGVEQKKDMIQVAVKDTGIGIGKQSLHKIFDKYHRIEEHAIHFQGLGIGLFISWEIIQRHRGKLWAESEPGKGSTFYFTLPLYPPEPPQ